MAQNPAILEEITKVKTYRKELDEVLQKMKEPFDTTKNFTTTSAIGIRERALAITKVQEGIMWLGMNLKELEQIPTRLLTIQQMQQSNQQRTD